MNPSRISQLIHVKQEIIGPIIAIMTLIMGYNVLNLSAIWLRLNRGFEDDV